MDGSDTDREPARGNVIPPYVNDHRRASANALRLHGNARTVDRDELSFDRWIPGTDNLYRVEGWFYFPGRGVEPSGAIPFPVSSTSRIATG